MVGQVLEIEGRRIEVRNLEKVFYPKTGFTKGDVLQYYARVAPAMLPHLKDRPLTLKRYPEGVEAEFFYQKDCPPHRPDWFTTVKVESSDRTIAYCVADDLASLVWLANIADLEYHTFLARQPELGRPTMMVFDLDPGPGMAMPDLARLALELRDRLRSDGLECWVKTSGGKGLQPYVPLNTVHTYDDTKGYSRAMAEEFSAKKRDRVTANMRKDLRRNRILIDWSQNSAHKSTVCVYSLRARDHPTVSTPITWAEVEEAAAGKTPLVFEAPDVLARVDRQGDLFAPVLTKTQRLPKAARAPV